MKKVIGIFMAMVMVFIMMSMALGDAYNWYDEVKDFCNDNRNLEQYVAVEGDYNIVNGVAYACGNIGSQYTDMYDFMDNYPNYLKKYWPEFAEDVIIDYTYAGSTEHTYILCVWLKLENGKVFSDYVEYEPNVTEMSALVLFDKE